MSRLFRRTRSSEEGFTLIELVIAMGVIMISLFALAYTLSIGFTGIAMARQRQSASGLANQTMEQIRALPFDTLVNGLSDNDIAGDPNIKTGVQCPPGYAYCYGGEELAHANYAVPTYSSLSQDNYNPLAPHISGTKGWPAVKIGPTTYVIRRYVTKYLDAQGNQAARTYRVTVNVTWSNPKATILGSTVTTQTVIYSPTGCLNTQNHPFAAPCQPFLYASSVLLPGSVDLTGTLAGVSFTQASLKTAGMDSSMQIEQTAGVQGQATASGAKLVIPGQNDTVEGTGTVTSSADSDPSQQSPVYDPETLGPYTPGILTVGSSNSVSVGTSGTMGDSAKSTSTTAAINGTNNCAGLDGVNQNDSPAQPCGNSNVLRNGTLSTSATLAGVSQSVPIVSIPPVTTKVCPSTFQACAFTDRSVPSGDGLVQADLTRRLETVNLGGLPSNVPSSSLTGIKWTAGKYLVTLTGFTDRATAFAGASTNAPTATVSAGSITYYNGTGYTTLTTSQLNGAAIPILAHSVHLVYTDPSTLKSVTIDMTAALSTGGTTVSDPANCGSSCIRTSASAASNSPITGTFTYKVTVGTTVQADFTIAVNLGNLVAKTTYQAAPSGS